MLACPPFNIGRYSAFSSYCIAPTIFPSVSWKKIRVPTPGITNLGMTTLPPCFSTAATVSSIEGTEIVHS